MAWFTRVIRDWAFQAHLDADVQAYLNETRGSDVYYEFPEIISDAAKNAPYNTHFLVSEFYTQAYLDQTCAGIRTTNGNSYRKLAFNDSLYETLALALFKIKENYRADNGVFLTKSESETRLPILDNSIETTSYPIITNLDGFTIGYGISGVNNTFELNNLPLCFGTFISGIASTWKGEEDGEWAIIENGKTKDWEWYSYTVLGLMSQDFSEMTPNNDYAFYKKLYSPLDYYNPNTLVTTYIGANGESNEFYILNYDAVVGRLHTLEYFAPIYPNDNYTGDYPTRYGVLSIAAYGESYTINLRSVRFDAQNKIRLDSKAIISSAFGSINSAGNLIDSSMLPNGLLKNLAPIYCTYSNEDKAFIVGKFGSILFGRPSADNFTLEQTIDGYLVYPSNCVNFPNIALPKGELSTFVPEAPPKVKPKPPPPPPLPNGNPDPEDLNLKALFEQYKPLAVAAASYAANIGNYRGADHSNDTISIEQLTFEYLFIILGYFRAWVASSDRPTSTADLLYFCNFRGV